MVTEENRRNGPSPTREDSVAASSIRLPMPIAPVPGGNRRHAVDVTTSSHERRGGAIVRRSVGGLCYDRWRHGKGRPPADEACVAPRSLAARAAARGVARGTGANPERA